MTLPTSGFGGHRLTETIAPPRAFTPKHLADRILRSRDALGGERKYLTVLFADIQSSTAVIENLDEEEAIEKLDPAVRAMMASVYRFGGAVNRIQGDGIMALFGAPLALEHHALRACYAGLYMQKAVAELGDPDIAIRVGLHSGPVIVRSIGNDLSMNYDASGSTVHVAARMEQLAEVGEVRVTEDTIKLVEGFVEAKSLGSVSVKGLSEPMQLYRLGEGLSVRSRWQVRAARGLTELIGREEELAVLQQALERAKSGQAQVVAVVGEAGVGKSRLIHEFLLGAASPEVTVAETAGLPEGRQIPYLPIGNLLRAWLGVDDRDGPEDVSRKLSERIAAIDEQLSPHMSAFQDLLDVEVTDEVWRRLEPAERRPRFQRALREFAMRVARDAPFVLVIEDLHWIDAETQAVLDAIVESLDPVRLMLLVSFRPEYEHKLEGAGESHSVHLDSFAPNEAMRFLDTLLGDDEGLNELKTLLIARSHGIPLFMEELFRVLKGSGALQEANGRYVLTKQVEEIEIPATIQAVIAARIDRLPTETRSVLQVSSVIGETVPETLLTEVAGIDHEDLEGYLSELQDHGFLEEKQIVPDVEYAFKHILTRDVAYDSMRKRRRQEIHAAVVEAVETQYHNRIDEHVERLAHHTERGELWEAAVRYGQLAATKASERSAYGEAIAYFERALTAIGKLPREREWIEKAVDLRLGLKAPLGATGNIARMYDRLVEAEDLAKDLDDPKRLSTIKISQTLAFNLLGRLEEAMAAGTEGLSMAKDLGEPALVVAGCYNLAQANQWAGNFKSVIELLTPHRDLLTGPLRDQRIGTAGTTSVLWLGMLGAAEAYLGQFDKALMDVEAARAIAGELERPYDQVMADWYLGFALTHQGRAEEALPVLERASEICKRAKIIFLVPVVATSLGYAYTLLGRLDEATAFLDQAVGLSRKMGLSYGVAWSTCNLGFAHLLKGELEVAAGLAREVIELSAKRGHKGVEATARRLLAEALSGTAEPIPVEAEQEATSALKVAEGCDLRPEVAHCQLTLARIRSRVGDRDGAHSHASRAEAIYHELDMVSWVDEAEALSKA